MYIELVNNQNLKSNIEKIKEIYGDSAKITTEFYVHAYNDSVGCYITRRYGIGLVLRIYEKETNHYIDLPLTEVDTVYNLD